MYQKYWRVFVISNTLHSRTLFNILINYLVFSYIRIGGMNGSGSWPGTASGSEQQQVVNWPSLHLTYLVEHQKQPYDYFMQQIIWPALKANKYHDSKLWWGVLCFMCFAARLITNKVICYESNDISVLFCVCLVVLYCLLNIALHITAYNSAFYLHHYTLKGDYFLFR